jgi:hypothetical protein
MSLAALVVGADTDAGLGRVTEPVWRADEPPDGRGVGREGRREVVAVIGVPPV